MATLRPHLPAVILTLAVTAAVLWMGTPRPPQLSDHTSGNAALAAQLRSLAPRSGHQALAATVITPDTITPAAVGETTRGSGTTIQPGDPIEFGSITKTFNGFLLTDAATRGEVGSDDTLATHLPELSGTPIGEVTLIELASHRGGLPRLPDSVLREAALFSLTGTPNPYGTATRESILAEARVMQPMITRGTVQYSNLGATLLGWALADAAGAPDWETHVRQRLFEPLGIRAVLANNPDQIPPGTIPGYTANGFHPEPWTSPAFTPAGTSTFIASGAASAYAQAILRNQVPGMEAMDPLFDAGGPTRIGLAWHTTADSGRQLTWHDGGTAGFRTILVIDRAAQRAVFVVGNTDQSVTEIGFALVTGQPPPSGVNPYQFLIPGVAALFVAWFVLSAFKSRNRRAVLSTFAGAVTALALARLLGPWALVPAALWAGLVSAVAAAVLVTVRRWPRLDWHPRRFRTARWIAAGLNMLLASAVVVLTIASSAPPMP